MRTARHRSKVDKVGVFLFNSYITEGVLEEIFVGYGFCAYSRHNFLYFYIKKAVYFYTLNLFRGSMFVA